MAELKLIMLIVGVILFAFVFGKLGGIALSPEDKGDK